MTHHHDHNHNNGHHHDHNHSDSHGHSHSHDNGQSLELTFEQKLEKLFAHWIDHNESHKETFLTWAKRSKEAGLEKVAQNLKKAGQMSEDVTGQLKDALKNLRG